MLCSFFSWSQGSNRDQFNEAKKLLNEGKYYSAAVSFELLKFDSDYGRYAVFFKGYAYFKNGTIEKAIAEWEYLNGTYSGWIQNKEVLYWLVIAHFEVKNYSEGLTYLEAYQTKYGDDTFSMNIIDKYFSSLHLEVLTGYYRQFPNNPQIARILAIRLGAAENTAKHRELLAELSLKFNSSNSLFFDKSWLDTSTDTFDIAIVFPFMFDDLTNPNSVIRNKIVIEFYQGMCYGQSLLEAEGINLKFHDFDTNKSREKTNELLPKLQGADLIVGPLYQEQIEMVGAFSKQHKINMINPLTSNVAYVGDNPYAYIFKPSYETVVKSLSKELLSSDTNRNVAIFYSENERDAFSAAVMKKEFESNKHNIIAYRSLDETTSKDLLDELLEIVEEDYTRREADSISKIPGRKVIYGNRHSKANQAPKIAYEEKFLIPKDSIHHVVIASQSNAVINNILSAFASREAQVSIYGYGNWFAERTVNYEILQQLNVKLAISEYVNKESADYERFRDDFISKYYTSPSDFNVQGFEFTMFIGRILNTYGKYFQEGIQEGIQKGVVMEGTWYPGTHDNQIVPIIKMEEFQLKNLNTYEY